MHPVSGTQTHIYKYIQFVTLESLEIFEVFLQPTEDYTPLMLRPDEYTLAHNIAYKATCFSAH